MKLPHIRGATLIVAITLILAACGSSLAAAPVEVRRLVATPPNAVPSEDAAPSPPPMATATSIVPTATVTSKHKDHLGANVQAAGVDISGLTPVAAQQKLELALAPQFEPLLLQVSEITSTLKPADVGLKIPYDEMVAEALAAGDGARVPLRVSYDEASVRAMLQMLATHVDRAPSFPVITSTNQISRSFALSPGVRLDQQLAAQRIGTRLRTLSDTHTISLTLAADTGTGHPSVDLLQQQVEEIAGTSRGVVGVSVYDLDHEATVAQVNPDTVFSGASVMKAAIMLQTYLHLSSFSMQQERWLQQMIINSDNSAANHLLASSVNRSGYAGTVAGAEQMTAMLREFGLEHTYQYAPYLAPDLVIQRNVRVRSGPVQEGLAPYTKADRFLRATPAEMSKIFLLIHQCSQGRGDLLAHYPDQLTSARCQEMIDRLHANADDSRLVAGFPDNTYVAHKSGWIDDMQADVGIVHTAGGNFLIAVYIYQSQGMSAVRAAPVIPALARLVYTYYNPIRQ